MYYTTAGASLLFTIRIYWYSTNSIQPSRGARTQTHKAGSHATGPVYLSVSRFLSGMMCLSHHDTIAGGTTHGWCTVSRAAVPPDGVSGFPQPAPGRVSGGSPALRDRVPMPYGGVADGWEPPGPLVGLP